MRHAKNLVMLLASAALMVGCFGGGGDDDVAGGGGGPTEPPAPVASVPDAISGSVDALIAYLSELVGRSDDSTEPLGVTAFVPPTSDTTEPATLP